MYLKMRMVLISLIEIMLRFEILFSLIFILSHFFFFLKVILWGSQYDEPAFLQTLGVKLWSLCMWRGE